MLVKKIPLCNKKKSKQIQIGQFGMARYGRLNTLEEWPKPKQPIFMEWYNCRDSFHYNFDHSDHKQFFYACSYESVKAVIDHVERTLKLTFRTQICHSNVKGVVWIKPARFWCVQQMRLSLFTILLRVALHYKDDFDAAVLLEPQGTNTKEAIDYFLSGKCYYVGMEEGWYQQFDCRLLSHYGKNLTDLLKSSNFLKETKLAFLSKFH